ncbi:hypothetical protein D7Y27_00060 [Corallococcus sp. AB004]|nr:hypothetical protein D7Y27_00060 [Corallococcus sp. AB004]
MPPFTRYVKAAGNNQAKIVFLALQPVFDTTTEDRTEGQFWQNNNMSALSFCILKRCGYALPSLFCIAK